uniref:40S ribosomal protein S21 n=1 Tax=Rhinolophus ferrumequinum TaxID=59479 RepID=A0A671DT87_RHIFE
VQNDAGEFVDLYVPQKCPASNHIIGAKDHTSIQMNVSEVDKVTGRFNGSQCSGKHHSISTCCNQDRWCPGVTLGTL